MEVASTKDSARRMPWMVVSNRGPTDETNAALVRAAELARAVREFAARDPKGRVRIGKVAEHLARDPGSGSWDSDRRRTIRMKWIATALKPDGTEMQGGYYTAGAEDPPPAI